MKKLFNTIAITVALLSATSCGDFLEPYSTHEFIPEDAVSLNELLLGEAYMHNELTGFNIFLNLLDDDIEASPYQESIEGFNPNKYLAVFTWQPDMYRMMEEAGTSKTNMYKSYYQLILGTNAVIDYLPKVNDTEENKNKIKVQAYALRGFYYLNLVNIYGKPYNCDSTALGVPLKLQSGIEPSDDYLKRKTVAEVYAQILSDLHTSEAAYMELPESERWNDNYRTSLPMVQLLLSRTYLYMENWEKAAEYAKKVIEYKHTGSVKSRFSLVDLNDVPLVEGVNDNGEEIRTYMNMGTYKCSETIWAYGNVEDMFEWVYEGTNSEHLVTGKKIHAYFQASESLLDSYLKWDLRLDRYIVRAPLEDGNVMPMAYGKINIGTKYYLPLTATGTFGRSLRLSEAYLNYAEALAMLGGSGDDEATAALNTLREKRFDPEDFEEVEFSSNAELVQFVREERRRELCFEGHRWFDLRRWGMPAITHTWHNSSSQSSSYTLQEGDLLYTVPIPDEALQSNASLVQNELPGKRTAQ